MGFFIVSHTALLRDLIASFCAGEGIEVRGCVETLADVRASSSKPNILLHIADDDTAETLGIQAFREKFANARIVVICSRHMYAVFDSLPPGLVDAMVLDDSSIKSLSGVLTLVHEGFVITPAAQAPSARRETAPDTAKPAGQPRPPEDEPFGQPAMRPPSGTRDQKTSQARPAGRRNKLSLREEAVIRKLCEGASNKDIANDLKIGESTVKVHLRTCYRKIGVRNRTQAAIWATTHLLGPTRLN